MVPRRTTSRTLKQTRADEGEISAKAELHIMKIQVSGPPDGGYSRTARLAARIAMLRFRIMVMMRNWLA